MKHIKLFENFNQDDLTREIEAYLGVDLQTFGEVQKVLALSPEGLEKWIDDELEKEEPNLRVIIELERLGYTDILEADLFYAAIKDKIGLAKYLLDRGDDIESRNGDGATPLHIAAAFDSLKVATLLLDRGADINTGDENQYTPLYYTWANDSFQVENLLRSRGATKTKIQ